MKMTGATAAAAAGAVTAGAVLGLKEIKGYLDGEYDLERAKDLVKMNTRRFAKRQLTWFRADRRIRWFDVRRISEGAVIKKIEREIWNARS